MIKSNEWLILLVGLFLSTFVVILFGATTEDFSGFDVILFSFFILVGVIWVIYKRTNEIKEELIKLNKENKRLHEKLKIHEQLIDIKADIKRLKNDPIDFVLDLLKIIILSVGAFLIIRALIQVI